MAPRHVLSAHRFPPRSFVALALLLAGSAGLPRSGFANPSRWTPPRQWSGIAVHMALLPSDGKPYHSKILWWNEENNTTFVGGQWGWRVPTSSLDCTSYPNSFLDSLRIPDPSTVAGHKINLFCAGFVPLSDGKLLVVGGTEEGSENGMKHTFIFTPGTGSDTAAGSWAQVDSMTQRRWYPTATVMKDGKVLATSGGEYAQMELYGGRGSSSANPSDSALYRFGVVAYGVWDPPVVPHSQPWPGPLLGQSAALVGAYGNVTYFGGRDQNGKLTNTTWQIFRNPATTLSDYFYTWADPLPAGASKPDPRCDHSAIVHGTGAESLLVFGGLAKPGSGTEAAVNDVWQLRITSDGWRWDQVTTNAAGGPSARYGHTAFYDVDRRRMIVFGGTADGQTPADLVVWAFQYNAGSSTAGHWKQLTVVSSSQLPSARFEHSMEWDVVSRDYTVSTSDHVNGVHSATLFGGRASGGVRLNDCWQLLLLSDSTVRWVPITTSGTPPSPRNSHTGTFGGANDRLYVFGGESASGVTDDTMYVLQLDPTLTNASKWAPFLTRGGPASNHTAVFNQAMFNRVPEVFDPASPHWSQQSGKLLQDWYPQTFVTKGSKLFVSGPSDSTWYFNPGSQT